jgi:hypothetical protein
MPTHLTPREDGKYILQILLPAAKGDFYVKYVENELEQQVTAFTKSLVFDFVKGIASPKQYEELEQKDKDEWQAGIQRRLNSRKQTQNNKQS